jgi:hypothetical protein
MNGRKNDEQCFNSRRIDRDHNKTKSSKAEEKNHTESCQEKRRLKRRKRGEKKATHQIAAHQEMNGGKRRAML